MILTDLPPTTVDGAWYAWRAWIECGFKDSKRGGWHWEQTKTLAPARAVATLWTVSVGCQAEVGQPKPQLTQLPKQHIARKRATGQRPARSLSCFRRGRLVILAALCLGQPLPVGFVILQSREELDVVAVYTAAGATGQVETLHLERVSPRTLRLQRGSPRRP